MAIYIYSVVYIFVHFQLFMGLYENDFLPAARNVPIWIIVTSIKFDLTGCS